MKNYDVIIIGAGSIGLACAWILSEKRLKVLVIEKKASFAQGENKAAIGGIRAAHSEPVKIDLCQKSIEVFSGWQEKYGDDIHWTQGGYLYPAYSENTEITLKNLLEIQQKNKLEIKWITPEETLEIVKGIRREGLRGSSFSSQDGHLSSLLIAAAYHRQATKKSADFHFGETVLKIYDKKVITDKNEYSCDTIILCTGVENTESMSGIKLPIVRERHEAAITEEAPFITNAMVVDIEKKENGSSFYFYQNMEGQIIFCLSPDPPIIAEKRTCTSSFLINASRRMLRLIASAAAIKVRRTWAGFYPMTPDGVPFVDKMTDTDIYFALGMCGQGVMLGPGIALNIAEMIINGNTLTDADLMKSLASDRAFVSAEALK